MSEESRQDATFASVEEAIEDLRRGRMIIILDDEDRENEGDLTCAAEFATPEIVNFMATHGRGLICLTMTPTQIDRLVRAMAGWPWAQAQLPNGDAVRILRGEASSFRPDGDSSAGNGGGGHSVEAGQQGSGEGEILRLEGGIFVRCGEGVFRIDELQRAGKAALAVADFLRGCPLQIGDRLT